MKRLPFTFTAITFAAVITGTAPAAPKATPTPAAERKPAGAQAVDATTPSPFKATPAPRPKIKESPDRAFMRKATDNNLKEVALGQLAAGKAQNPDVREFAARMISAHTKAGEELRTLAMSKGVVTLPRKPSPENQAAIDRIAKLSGTQFDAAYAKEMVRDHQRDVTEFEKIAKTTQDAELKRWVDRTLPVLRDHLGQAKELPAVATGSGARSR